MFASRGRNHRLAWTLTATAVLCSAALLPGRRAPAADAAPDKLVCRPLPAPAADKALAAGDEVRTGPRERRRLALPDGSVLLVNQNTTLQVTMEDHLKVTAGEVLVVAFNPNYHYLYITTPKRDLKARGARFGVRVTDAGTGLVVVSGSVLVEGLKSVDSGRRLLPGKDEPVAGPQPAHLLGWASDLMDPAGATLVPPSPHGGGSLVAVDPDGHEAKLSLRKSHIDTYIEDGFARTTVDQTYFNHTSQRLEGTFYFPLPPDASLSRLAMYVDGSLMEGGMVDRDYGRDVYETVVYRKKDPALLEWVDGSTFKMRVFPLEPRQEKRVLLSYVQKLPSLYGQETYRFPSGHSLDKVGAWSFHARIKDGGKRAWNSPSHALQASQDGADLVLDGAEKNVKADRDVVLALSEVDAAAPPAEAARFAFTVQDGAKYLLTRWRPELPGGGERKPRDWVFLVETSGDRDPLLARTQVEIVRALLADAGPKDTVVVLAAGTRVGVLPPPAAEAATTPIRANAVAFLEQAHLIGAFDLGAALTEAEPWLKIRDNPYLVHIGSGVPAMGERRTDELVKRIPAKAVYVGVGVGRRWNRTFMKAAAERTGGVFTQINPDEKIAWRSFELSSALDAPRLLNVTVKDKTERVTFLNLADSLAQGEELCSVARLEADAPLPETVVVRGVLDGKAFERELPVKDPVPKADYLPRVWAKLEIERLLTEDAAKHKDLIVGLSKAMYVMTPFTSLLVLENEEMYQQYKVDRGRKDHWAMYPCPEKIPVVYEDLDGNPGDPAKGIKPDARQVVKTIQVREPPRALGSPRERMDMDVPPPPTPSGVQVVQLSVLKQLKEQLVLTGLNDTEEERQVIRHELQKDRDYELNRISGGTVLSPRTVTVPINDLGYYGPASATIVRGQAIAVRGFAFAPDHSSRAENERQLRLLDSLQLASGKNNPRARTTMSADALLYRRPGYSGDERLFFDLLTYAPGLNTTPADVLAVLEDEAAAGPESKPGVLDDGARALFDKARPDGWQSLLFPAEGDRPAWTLYFDGAGRYVSDRTQPIGVRERVICDGKTLLHVYPDLGLAGSRAVSRFHRLAFARLAPWALPRPEDLARGADLRLVGERTVAVVPHGADDAKDEDGKPLPYSQVQLVFAADGSLAERRLVELPSKKLLGRETYSADGVVKLLDGDGKELAVRKATLAAAKAPDLKADLKEIVVLPLPFRGRDLVTKTLHLEKKTYDTMTFEEGLAMLAACVGQQDEKEALSCYTLCFHNRGQRKIGFYVLLAACGANLDGEHVDVLTEHPRDPLAQYLALYSSPVLRRHASQWAVGGSQWGDGFLQRLALSHALSQRWQNGKAIGGTDAQRLAELDAALDYVRRGKGAAFGWVLLALIQDRARDDENNKKDAGPTHLALADAFLLYADVPGLEYAARYENARSLWKGGRRSEARKRFRELYEKTLADDELPAIDGDFRQALLGEGKEADEWGDLLRKTAARLIEKKHRPAVFALAEQCWQMNDQASANQLVAAALDGVKDDKDRLSLQAAAVSFYLDTAQLPEADGMLQAVLADPKQGENPAWLRAAADLAARRDMPARELECLERALDLEYRDPPEVIDVEAVRRDYGKLLEHYQRLAEALVVLQTPAPPNFTARVIRAADHWRALETEPGRPCDLAARILRTRGERDLVWDYLTTPIGLRPNEAEPWVELAKNLSRQGDLELADRAYASACQTEPTNAQILWDRARNLRESGKVEEARTLYRRIADGDWQPRFQGIQRQAKWQLEQR